PLGRRDPAAQRQLARSNEGASQGRSTADAGRDRRAMTVLKTAIATYPHTKALKDGTVTMPGLELDHVEVSPIVGAFRRMVRTLEFDVCEMAITTYLTARAFGKPFTALPVFVMRQFHHSPIVYNVKSGV